MENASTTENKQKKDWFKYYGWVALFFIISVSGLILDLYLTHKDNQAKSIETIEVRATLERERADKTSCVYTKDSLWLAVKQLSTYKALTQAMVHRDEATSQIMHKVGEMVYMKNDSSRVVIEDIIIGGSKYNYYVKYKVLYKDNISKEVAPELVY